MHLSLLERKLFVEVGHHITRVMWQNLGDSDPTFNAVMYDRAESVYETGCGILEQLGIFSSEGPHLSRFAIPLNEVRDYLKAQSPKSIYTLDEIIGNFLWATAGYQGDVSDEKAPFEVPRYLQQAMWAFVQLDYATREPNGFKWTEKIAPIMKAEVLWCHETGESFTTLYKKETEDLGSQIWSVISIWHRHFLARWMTRKSELDLFVYLSSGLNHLN